MADTNLLKTGKHGLIKSYITYDASSRMEYVYEAAAEAIDGQTCLRTQYVYSGVSTRVIKMKETASIWVSATMDV